MLLQRCAPPERCSITGPAHAATDWKAIKSTTGVGVTLTILGPEELPRETHKAKRVDDRRGRADSSPPAGRVTQDDPGRPRTTQEGPGAVTT